LSRNEAISDFLNVHEMSTTANVQKYNNDTLI